MPSFLFAVSSALRNDRRAIIALEYALIAGMSATTLAASLASLGVSINTLFGHLTAAIMAADSFVTP